MSEMSFFESLLVDYLIELCVCLVCVLFGLGVVLLGLMFFSQKIYMWLVELLIFKLLFG